MSEPRDPRIEQLAAGIAQMKGLVRWLAGLCTTAGVVAGAAGLLLWAMVAGGRLDDSVGGAIGSVLVLVLFLLPALWLVNVRFALTAFADLPSRLGQVAESRRLSAGDRRAERPEGGPIAAAKSLHSAARDYGEIVAARALAAQLISPMFWGLTALAVLAIPILLFVTFITAIVKLLV